MEHFKVVIVEDVKLELKGTEQIFRSDIPEAEIMTFGSALKLMALDSSLETAR